MPPRDYYSALSDVPVQSVNGSVESSFEFVPRYHGKHFIVLVSQRAKLHASRIDFDIRCAAGERAVHNRADGARSDTVWSGTPGFAVLVFDTPSAFVQGEAVNCSLAVRSTGDMVGSRVLVAKLSDI
jgi:hypothetical protein